EPSFRLRYFWSLPGRPFFGHWLRLGIRKQLLSHLFHLFQDAALIAGAVDGRLKFFAELGEPFEPLMFVESCDRGGFQRHKFISSAIDSWATTRMPATCRRTCLSAPTRDCSAFEGSRRLARGCIASA